MDFFKGIEFVGCGNTPESNVFMTRQFKDYYGIQYNHNSNFLVEIDQKYQRTVSGSWVLLTRPGPIFRYGPPPGQTRPHAFICFRGPRVEEYISSGLLPLNAQEPLIKITRPERFRETLQRLIIAVNPSLDYSMAVNLLENLLLQLHDQPFKADTVPKYLREKCHVLEAEINSHPELDWNFMKEAAASGISYAHFRRVFRQLTGAPPGKFLIQARLRKAAGMLVFGNEQVATVSEQCGFGDQFYFARLFRKYYNISPSRYRTEFDQPQACRNTNKTLP